MTSGQPLDDCVRYDWPALVRYWRSHNHVRGSFTYSNDPDGLGNVCHAGAPLVVNQYYHRGQERVYRSLLADVPVAWHALALDVGCGAARWARLLSSRGFGVTGIDLQDELIAANRARHPEMQFEAVAIQDFERDHQFDLISSVTVLQHIPHDEQKRAVQSMARLVAPGGHVLILENIADKASPVVFSNSIAGWTGLFGEEGFQRLRVRPYDYSPALRAYYAATRRVRQLSRGHRRGQLPEPEEFDTPLPPGWPTRLARIDDAAKTVASVLDSVAEPLLVRLAPPVPTVHAGFLFRKTGSADT